MKITLNENNTNNLLLQMCLAILYLILGVIVIL